MCLYKLRDPLGRKGEKKSDSKINNNNKRRRFFIFPSEREMI